MWKHFFGGGVGRGVLGHHSGNQGSNAFDITCEKIYVKF